MLTCTRTELSQSVLRQQCLSDPADSVEEAVTQMLGCRAAEGSTPYLSLLWRVKEFHPVHFDNAVHHERSLLRVRGPRGTYYWVTPAFAPLFLAAARNEQPSEFLLRWGLQEGEYQAITEEVIIALTGGPLALRDLKQRIPVALQRPVVRKGFAASTSLGVILEAMQLSGEVTLLKEPGFDRHRSREYYGDARDITRPNLVGLVAELYPTVQLESWDHAEARRALVRTYIQRFGPVTAQDVTWWTGWTKGEIKRHLQALSGEFAEVSVQGLTDTFLVHRHTWDPVSQPAHNRDPIAQLLPGGDSLMKGYDGFGRFLVRSNHDHNVLRFMPTALVGGLGYGNWAYRLSQSKIEVVVQLFEHAEQWMSQPIRHAACRIGHMITGGTVPMEFSFQVRTGGWNPRDSFPPLPVT